MDDAPPRLPRPANEAARLAALRRTGLLDSGAEDDFDFLAMLAAEALRTPCAFISLVDGERVWFKSAVGRVERSLTELPRDDDYCSLAILEPGPLHVPDLAADPRTARMAPTLPPLCCRMYAGANLVTEDGFRIGTLCVVDQAPRTLGDRETAILERLARQVMQLIELRARRRELEAAMKQLEALAATDALTGLPNRRTLMARLAMEVERARRFGTPLAVALIDLDRFKSINDRFGHAAGDAVLAAAGKALAGEVRAIDLAARYGGEEFCVVFPGTGSAGARAWAEGCRAALSGITLPDGAPLTASFGVADLARLPVASAETLLARADKALYAAKAAGRDRVSVAPAGGLAMVQAVAG